MLKTKKLNRTLALCLCFVMMFSITAFAADTSNELLPLSVVEFFADQGYEISRTAKMELIQDVPQVSAYGVNSITDDQKYTLRIIEQNGNEVTVYNTILLTENEAGSYERDDDILEYIITRGGGTPTSGGSANVNGQISITARTTYTTRTKIGLGTLYVPSHLTFSYTKQSNVTVNNLTVSYTTNGNAYSLSDLSHVTDEYSHVIQKSVNNPSQGTSYTEIDFCPYALDIGSGGTIHTPGMILWYYVTINGADYDAEIY